MTGRPRRCGWLDLVALKYSARINSLSGLIVTRADVLSGIGDLKVATGYSCGGRKLDCMPSTVADWKGVEATYETLEGWSGDITGARKLEDLPSSTRTYLDFIAEYVGVPVAIVSIGPDRLETIIARPELIWG